MANSTSSFLKLTVQATGENSGTWGQITNTNLLIVEQAIAGYEAVALNATTGATLTVSNGAVSNGKNAVLQLTGTITTNVNVVVPVVEKVYIVDNATSGAYSVTVKTSSGSGVVWAAADKGTKMVYGDGTNIVDTAFTELSSDFSPQLSADLDTNGQNIIIDNTKSINDENGNEQVKFATTGSAVNEVSVTNAASSNGPILSSTGGDTNIDLNLNPKGSGVLKSATAAIKIAGKETIWIPATAMYGPTTNPADVALVETTATRPDLNVFDFDASTKQYTQFTIGMPKSWNEGTLTYQVYWSPSSTNTGNAIFGLQGVACADNDTIDVAFGTAIEVTDAGIGTVEDQQVTSESSAMTVAGSPAAGEQTYFQLYRDAADGSDTFSGECRVLGIKVFYTTDAANDA